MSGGRQHQRHVVLVGGLTDGLMSQYVVPLAARLEAQQWSLVQALLSSSHAGYGLASLDQDADELHALACHLKVEYGSQASGQEWDLVGGWGSRVPLMRQHLASTLRHCTTTPLQRLSNRDS